MNDTEGLAKIVARGVRPVWATDGYIRDMRDQHTRAAAMGDPAIRQRAGEMLALWAQIEKLPGAAERKGRA